MNDQDNNEETKITYELPDKVEAEPVARWGEFSVEDGHLELHIPDTDSIIPVELLAEDRCVLGRPSAAPMSDLNKIDTTNPEKTVATISSEDRKLLIEMSRQDKEAQDRVAQFSDETKLVDLEPYGGLKMGISRRHAIIERSNRVLYLTDLRSVNGTYLNGDALIPLQRRIIRDGDEIQVGNLKMRVRLCKDKTTDSLEDILLAESSPPVQVKPPALDEETLRISPFSMLSTPPIVSDANAKSSSNDAEVPSE